MRDGFILDSNVIIDYFGNKLPEKSINIIESHDLYVSSISEIEVLGFKLDGKVESDFLDFFRVVNKIDLDNKVIQEAIQIRKLKKIKLGDAIIAATALVHNLKLITRNFSDFKAIKNLELINSFPQ